MLKYFEQSQAEERKEQQEAAAKLREIGDMRRAPRQRVWEPRHVS